MSFFSKILGIDKVKNMNAELQARAEEDVENRKIAEIAKTQTAEISADNKKYIQYGAILLAVIVVIILIIYSVKKS